MKFNWRNGRQQATQSLKKLLLCKGKTWDCYLLSIPKSKIHWHFDRVEGKEHHRFNLTLWGLWKFWTRGQLVKGSAFEYHTQKWQFPFKWHIFRPDLKEHAAEIFKNTLILSVGWVK